MLQKICSLKIYAKYILLVPRNFCILYFDFNINNLFKFIPSSHSVRMHYFTGGSGLHFFQRL